MHYRVFDGILVRGSFIKDVETLRESNLAQNPTKNEQNRINVWTEEQGAEIRNFSRP